ncbi:MAG: DUF2059 domain-containing protein [Pseudomonadales bacterium]|jgi:hypothetical protein|nr:DUF2059 domain-containing protein [Pseudomonadales bacterium]
MRPAPLPTRLLLTLCLALPGAAVATEATTSEAAHEAAALEVLDLIGIDSGVEPMMQRMREATLTRIVALLPQPADEATVGPYLERIGTIIERTLTWGSLRGEFVDAYTATFTEAELKSLAEFFRSPVGAKYLANVTDLNRVAMEIVRENATAAAPEISEITDELLAAVEANQQTP